VNRKERRAHASRGVDIGDARLKYGGRTIELKIVINTDETVDEVVSRVAPAAKGPGQRMVLVSGGLVEAESAEAFWSDVLPHVKQQAARGGQT
jgi:hypothetical protein